MVAVGWVGGREELTRRGRGGEGTRAGGDRGGSGRTSLFWYSRSTFMQRMRQLVSFLGMPGWRPPWSMTRPCTSRDSMPDRCCMCMISTMCRSMGSPSRRMQRT